MTTIENYQIRIFESPEFGKVRTMVDNDGNPLFCGKDVCEVLGYKRTDHAIRQHVNLNDVLKQDVSTPIVSQGRETGMSKRMEMLFVNESGLYCLVFGSKMPSAQRFKKWVTNVVLPQIRMTGGYIPLREGDTYEDVVKRAKHVLCDTLQRKDDIIAAQQRVINGQRAVIDDSHKRIAWQDGEIDRLLPKALYADNVLNSISCYTTTQIAKELGMTAQELNRQLCALHIQYYQSGQYMLYADYAHMGLAQNRTHYHVSLARERVVTHTFLVWTERGRKLIHKKVKREE